MVRSALQKLMVVAATLAGLLAAGIAATPAAAAAAAPTLVVSGNHLIDTRSNTTFTPHGVNWPSFEYACQQGWDYSGGFSPAEAAAIASWKVNIVRIPLNENCWLGTGGSPAFGTASGYRSSVQTWVNELHAAGVAVILDLHWTAPAGYVADGQRAMPDAQSTTFWNSVATMFASDHSVVFDLFNEPYSRYNDATDSWAFQLTWSCWKDGGCQAPVENDDTATLSGATYTVVGMSQLVNTVRAAGATQPIMLGGLDYSNDLRGWLANRPSDSQLIASWHNYPGQRCQAAACWNSEIAPVAASVPVIASEFGETDGGSSFLSAFMTWADSHGIGYAPWAWWDVPASESVDSSRYALYSGSSFTPKAPAGTTYHDHLAALATPGGGDTPPPTLPRPSGPPFGSLDVASASVTTVSIGGWAIDPDTTDAITVHVYVDGSFARALTANGQRADLASIGYGTNHGFTAALSGLSGGSHQVCAYGINVGTAANNSLLGCSTVTIRTGSPFGSLDSATAQPGSVTVAGWALDPDTTNAITVHVYIDGRFATAMSANGSRPDVGAAFGYGNAHGFSATIANVPGGTHQVCAYGINAGPTADNALIGCRSLTVRSGPPFGALDTAFGITTGKLYVEGWAIDPDTTAAVIVHVYVDGRFATALTANLARPDVGAAFGYGDGHGYVSMFASTPGTHTVCTYAINVGPAADNSLLGCRQTTVSG